MDFYGCVCVCVCAHMHVCQYPRISERQGNISVHVSNGGDVVGKMVSRTGNYRNYELIPQEYFEKNKIKSFSLFF